MIRLVIFGLLVCLQSASFASGAENDPAAAYRMGRYGEAFAAWQKSAEAGDSESQYRLSNCFARGLGIGRDQGQALVWLMRAAEGGHPRAAYDLAMSYDRKGGDATAMVKWTRIAAQRGVPEAQYNLATLLEEGDKVPRDLVQAFAWYRAAAEAFHSVDDNEHLERISAQLSPTDLKKALALASEILRNAGGK